MLTVTVMRGISKESSRTDVTINSNKRHVLRGPDDQPAHQQGDLVVFVLFCA